MKHTGIKKPLGVGLWAFLCIPVQLTVSAELLVLSPTSEVYVDLRNGSTRTFEGLDSERLGEQLTAANEQESSDQTTPETPVENQRYVLDRSSVSSMKSPWLSTSDVDPEPTPFPAQFPTENPLHGRDGNPKDLFSPEECKQGWVLLYIAGMLYLFSALVIVCSEFFVPAVNVITDKMAISDDVAGATVMAAGRSIPKFFAFFVGVVVAQSKVGIGTLVGSAVYNILFVIGMCALFSGKVIHLTWRPFFRDMSFYIFLLILIIVFFLDNAIVWWESMLLLVGYTVYVIFLKFDAQLEQLFKTQLGKRKNKLKFITSEDQEMGGVPAGEHESGGSEDSDTDRGDSKKYSDDCRNNGNNESENKEEETTQNNLLSLKWPETTCEQIAFLLKLPIVLPLWLTLPDVRNQKSRKLFVMTFLVSIVWITLLTHLILWFGHQVGETVGISHHIMTILVGGSANADLITSVIVARKGLGDMAVSSSVGSNIFDITVGLPVSWLLFLSVHDLASVAVCTNGLVCACVLLFLMLLFAIIFIPSCKWRIGKVLGSTMIVLYTLFLVVSFLLQYHIIVCPVGR